MLGGKFDALFGGIGNVQKFPSPRHHQQHLPHRQEPGARRSEPAPGLCRRDRSASTTRSGPAPDVRAAYDNLNRALVEAAFGIPTNTYNVGLIVAAKNVGGIIARYRRHLRRPHHRVHALSLPGRQGETALSLAADPVLSVRGLAVTFIGAGRRCRRCAASISMCMPTRCSASSANPAPARASPRWRSTGLLADTARVAGSIRLGALEVTTADARDAAANARPAMSA